MNLISHMLWNFYGYLYDGLRYFYPYKNLIAQTIAWLELKPSLKLLDLGCGTGNVLEYICRVDHATAVGVDISPTMLAVGRRKLARPIAEQRLQLYQANLVDHLRSLPDSSFDRIVSVNVFYALNSADRRVVWREAERVLKPGGLMVVNTSIRTGSGRIIQEHLRYAPWWHLLHPKLIGVFCVDSLINLLGDAGHFDFPDREMLRSEAEAAGWRWLKDARCYGGPRHGVNVICALEKP